MRSNPLYLPVGKGVANWVGMVWVESKLLASHRHHPNRNISTLKNYMYFMLIWSIAVTPQINFMASPSMVPVDGNTLLTCTITAEPVANFSQIVRIIPNGEPAVLAEELNPDGDRKFELTYMFNRVNFPDDDGAEFQCRATNDNGLNTQNIMITVQGELYIE